MIIGTLIVTDNNQEIFRHDVTAISIASGRLFAQIENTFLTNIPFMKNKIYQLQFEGIPEMEGNVFDVMYSDYTFNAGGTEYVDREGQTHTGVCVLSNQLEFLLMN